MIGTDGVRLAVRIFPGPEADAPEVVLHHGLASSQHIWDLMLPALSRTFRVVTFDARGHGRSAKPGGGYGFDHTVGDALAVLRATRSRKPLLVGHSWGAMVALEVQHQQVELGQAALQSVQTTFVTGLDQERDQLGHPNEPGPVTLGARGRC